MKKQVCLFLFIAILLSGCSGLPSPTIEQSPKPPDQLPSPTDTLTYIPFPTRTGTPTQATQTPTATITQKPSKTPTPTTTPYVDTYSLKNIWIEFGLSQSGHADFEIAFPVVIPNWVLYRDGTLIVYKMYQDGSIWVKSLSESEICGLLNRIESLGFYEIQTSGLNYEQDPIYVDVPPEKLWTDGGFEHLVVFGNPTKTLSVYEPIKEYAVQPVKKIMNALRGFSPAGMQVYQPDRLGLFVQYGRQYEELERLQAIPWPEDAPSLEEKNELGALYLEGEMASKIYHIFKTPYQNLVFTDNGQEFTVSARPLLPHEIRTNDGVNSGQRTNGFELPFKCK